MESIIYNMIDWKHISQTATVGTRRMPFSVEQNALPHDTLDLPELPEAALLMMAGTLALQHKAAYLGATFSNEEVNASEVEIFEYAPQEVQHLAESLLRKRAEGGVEELADLLLERELLFTPANIPAFFDWGMTSGMKSEDILRLVGKRGMWLAAKHPDWKSFLPLDESVWESGSMEEQLSWLGNLRRKYPTLAREKIAERLGQSSVQQLKKYLPLLRINLSEDDQVQLTQLQLHKRKEIRMLSTQIVSALPGSEWHQEIQAHLSERLEIRLLQKLSINWEAQWPQSPAWDLLECIPVALSQLGPGGRKVYRMLAITPWVWWEKQFGKSHEKLIAQVINGQDGLLFMLGWAEAAIRFANRPWAESLLQAMLQHALSPQHPLAHFINHNQSHNMIRSLVSLSHPESLDGLLLNLLRKAYSPSELSLLFQVITQGKVRLSETSSLLLGEKIRQGMDRASFRSEPAFHSLIHQLPALAPRLAWKSYPILQNMWATDPFQPQWFDPFAESCLRGLHLRHQMHQLLS
ncbi:MAG: DUF5691 domain-containing protein [Bacteroidota bacterium]